jgi:hypothetical protein
MKDILENNTIWNAVKDRGMRNLLVAFLDGKSLGMDDPESQGVPDLDQAIVTLVSQHHLDFEWETADAATGAGASYTLKESSVPVANVLLGRDGKAA